MVRKVISVLAASTAALFLGSMSYAAESAYPEKPITLLIPFPVGSGSDSTARVVAQELSKEIGQAVVVENKPGANGFIATRMAANAKPDGYTLLLTSNTHYANKFLFKNVPYDPIGDFVTVAVVRAPSPLVLAVSALTYGSGNSSSRVSAELYKQQIDADIVYVPYKGNADALNDVSAGRVDLIFSDVGAMRSMYEAGRIRALAITGEQKMPFLKGVKSTADLGLPGLELSSWGIFLAPKGTPEPIINKLHELISDTADTKPVKDLIAATDGIPTRMTRAEMDSFVQNELEKWGSIIQRAGIEPQ
jgi:tripartite-type tricarboxylate transporter receptor subunit TctC